MRERILPLHEYFQRTAERFPGKEMLVYGGRRVSYCSMRRDVELLAAHLLRADPDFVGKRACLFMKNSPEYVTSFFGILEAGGVVVPISDRISSRGAKVILEDCTPTIVILDDSVHQSISGVLGDLGFVRMIILVESGAYGSPERITGIASSVAASNPKICRLHEILESEKGGGGTVAAPEVPTDRVAMIIYTSGTTGNPKGVMLSHSNLVCNALSIIKYLKLTPDDKAMVVLPFYYSYGTSLLTTHVIAGGTLVLENSFLYPNLVLEKMIEERVTGFSGVPSTFAILLGRSSIRKYRFPHLRYVTQAGGAMSSRHTLELMEALPGKRVYVMYGQTEASARLSYLDPEVLPRKIGSIGKGIPGVELTVRRKDGSAATPGEVGEIVASGPNVMVGYWGSPQETRKVLREDGLHTGDLAKTDEEGYLYIVGRRSDIIKSGAHRISAKEIEEVILEIPAVHEVAVVGEKDHILGESIKACIVPEPGASCGKNEILAYCKANLPSYKIPKHVEFLAELPRTESGKVRKHLLAASGEDA